MFSHKVLTLVLVLPYMFSNCSSGDDAFARVYRTVLEENSGTRLFNALLALDQQYPDKIELKNKLAELLIISGDFDKAESYLKRAQELASGDNRLKSQVYLKLGVIQFEKKRYSESLEYAEKALALTEEDKQGIAFLKARNLYMMGKKQDAYDLYEKNWQDKKELLSRFDMNIYFEQCANAKNYIRALEVTNNYQMRFEYLPGQGVQASQIYEQLGMIDEAVLAAAMELEYLFYTGGVTKAQIAEKLTEIGNKLDDKNFNPKSLGKGTLRGLSYYFNDNFTAAKQIFLGRNISHQYYAYLKAVSILETEGASVELLRDYVQFEKYFKSLQGYYYHFWQGMKKGKGEYDFKVAREILEKCVMLSPASPSALETRREIARLIGLDPSFGEKLLLPPELDDLYSRIINGEDPNILDPAMDLLSIPDNIYTMSGVILLRDLKTGSQAVKAYLEKKKAVASGRQKERLVMILEG